MATLTHQDEAPESSASSAVCLPFFRHRRRIVRHPYHQRRRRDESIPLGGYHVRPTKRLRDQIATFLGRPRPPRNAGALSGHATLVSAEKSREIRRPSFGKRRKSFAGLGRLQTLPEQGPFAADLRGDALGLPHQRFSMTEGARWRLCQRFRGTARLGIRSARGTTALARPQGTAEAASNGSPSANIA